MGNCCGREYAKDVDTKHDLKVTSSQHRIVNPEIEENATKSADLSQLYADSDAPPPHNEEVIESASSAIFEELPEEQKQHRANMMSQLRSEPASIDLQAYFERLEKGPPEIVEKGAPIWVIDTLIEGIKIFADLCGLKKGKYYDNLQKGLHYANSFTELWNRTHPQQPITVWDQDIRYQCPPSWSNNGRVLTYHGEAPASQGLNEVVIGPTTLDCGMWCPLALMMGFRYLMGDRLFNELIESGEEPLALTRNVYDPMNNSGTDGNLLYHFFDVPLDKDTMASLEFQTRIQLRPFFNHETYLAKHPGGEGRLYNVIRIDGYNIFFDPGARNILSDTELEQVLKQAYNNPRDFADAEKLWFYELAPDFVHPDYDPKSNRTLHEEAKKYAGHTLGESEWKDGRDKRKREADGLQLMFNFQRLIDCLEETSKCTSQ